jgi:hypothetical protein
MLAAAALSAVLVAAFSAVLPAPPARAADMATDMAAGVWAGEVRAGPFVAYDFEPGIVVREYWLRPWAGRHYFPSGDKLPVLGRREELKPAAVSTGRSFRREWTTFPVDTIQTPPLFLNQQQYFPSSEAVPPPPPTVSK